MIRFGRPQALLHGGTLAAAFFALALTGCGNDNFSDDAYGAIDLSPFFQDGATPTNPNAGIVRDVRPNRGWVEGKRVEFYDYGLVTPRRKRSAAGANINEPDIAYTSPIYFFYDGQGHPLFSKPYYDARTGTFYMKGGKDTLDPSPAQAPDPNDQTATAAYYGLPYSARIRPTIRDDLRNGSADYQRPVINSLPSDTNYAGLWEIVEVTVKDGNYKPDDIKSWNTLQSGVNAGKFSLNRTLKVINCPALDDRQFVTPSSLVFHQTSAGGGAYIVPQPRIEVWFRTKLGSCQLANGWETLGYTDEDAQGNELDPRDPANLHLYQPGDTDKRLDTFDVIRFTVGDGASAVVQVQVPVGKLYTPKVTITTTSPTKPTTDVRYFGDDITTALPRHYPSDPPGYSPIVWLWDINVPQDPQYVAGSFKKLADADPAQVKARDSASTVWARNYPITGVASPCGVTGHECDGFGQQCNYLPDFDLATLDPPPGQNLADVMIAREGGPRCDSPAKSFGEFCSPGIARCDSHVQAGSPRATALTALLGSTTAGPALTIYKTVSDAQAAVTAMSPGLMATINSPTAAQADKDAATAALKKLTDAVTAAQAKADMYKAKGYPVDLTGQGYSCQPPTGGGYCYVRCDGGASAGATTQKRMLTDDQGPGVIDSDRLVTFNNESRCGGTALLGYQCLPTSSRAEKQRVCVRSCTTRDTDAKNAAICNYPISNNAVDATSMIGDTPIMRTFSDGQPATATLPGQTCNALANVTACAWNPDFEPRGPSSVWPPQ